MAPAPRPCTSRNAISHAIEDAKPHSTDPTRKIATPTSSTGLRPNRSESLPNTIVVAVWASRNDPNTQEYKWRSPSWAAICGMAVGTMVASMAIINIAQITAATASGGGGVGPFATPFTNPKITETDPASLAGQPSIRLASTVMQPSSNCNVDVAGRCHERADDKPEV